jgi:hypothetical protein
MLLLLLLLLLLLRALCRATMTAASSAGSCLLPTLTLMVLHPDATRACAAATTSDTLPLPGSSPFTHTDTPALLPLLPLLPVLLPLLPVLLPLLPVLLPLLPVLLPLLPVLLPLLPLLPVLLPLLPLLLPLLPVLLPLLPLLPVLLPLLPLLLSSLPCRLDAKTPAKLMPCAAAKPCSSADSTANRTLGYSTSGFRPRTVLNHRVMLPLLSRARVLGTATPCSS